PALPVHPRGSTDTPRASLRLTRGGRSAMRGAPLWTPWMNLRRDSWPRTPRVHSYEHGWVHSGERPGEAVYVPPDTAFATKPKIATRMIARAITASVPFKWVAGDTVYGVGDIEQQLRQAGKGYVLGVSSAQVFRSWGKRRPVAGK